MSRTAIIIGCAVLVAAAVGLVATWRLSQHATALPKASCGSALTHSVDGDTQFLSADPGALNCFGKAAGACRAGGLAVTAMGTDTGTDYVFTVKPDGTACQVAEASQDYGENFGGSRGPVSTTSCRRISVTGSGVTLSCGGQDVLIPARVSPLKVA